MRKKKTTQSNIGIAAGFSFIVLGLIFLSLFLRILLLIGNSKFDGTNSLTIHVLGQDDQVVNFSPKSMSFSILTIKSHESNVGAFLEVPIDGSFYSAVEVNHSNISSVLAKNIFNFKNQTELSFMDFLRLFLFTNTVKPTSITEGSVSRQSNAQDYAAITSSLFTDPIILEEKQNIEIINSTDVSGLGNRLANLITNIGGNVILVTTGDLQKESQVQYAKKTYTAERLSRALGYKLVETTKKSIPDVIIIIGTDSLKNIKF